MAKEKTLFACTACGYETSRWVGRCPGCGAWNTMVESAPIVTGAPAKAPKQRPGTGASAMLLREIPEDVAVRSSTGISELDRVLGGGIVEGALMLIGGDPGIGKSTLLLQVCANLCKTGKRVLYVSGEESAKQLKLRANRLGITSETLYVLAENALDNVEEKLRGLSPDVAVIDSIQTMYRPDMASAPGSVSQIRECTSQIMRLCKESGTAIFLVGHVTKDGAIAGPRMLEHMVDVVLYFEGDRQQEYRLLRAVKNRFGSVNELGVFQMTEAGMQIVPNPSEQLLSHRAKGASGSVVFCGLEGSRPLLCDVQALASTSYFGTPRRTVGGADTGRVALLLAVLEKRANQKTYNQDVYINVAGGLELSEPAADLALCMAVVMLLSMAVTPAMAADTKDPPTEVTNCATSGFSTTVLALGFSDTAWMNAINAVKVNDVPYNKEKIDSFSSTTGIWEAGKYPFNGGVQGDLPALKFALNSGTSFPVTIVLSAKGYKDLTVKVTQADKWGDTYTAEAVVNSDSGNGGSGSTETPDTGKTAPTAVKYAYSSTMPAAHYFGADSDWLSAITGVQVNGTAYEKGSVEYYSSGNHWNIGKKDFNGYGPEAALVVLANSSVTYPAKFTITATDYPDVVIQVDKKGAATATIVQDTPAEYTVTAATDIENGTVKVSATSAKAGDTVTVTATPADGYELDTITVTDANGTAVAVNDSKFTMPAENVTVSAVFKAASVTPPASGDKGILLSRVKLTQEPFGNGWYVTFDEAGYVSKVSKVTVNGTEWEAKDYGVSSGGAYKKNTENNRLEFAAKDFSPNPTIPVLTSGNVITITAAGYKDLTMKFVVDADGKVSLVADDG